jgi:hypothetical protein
MRESDIQKKVMGMAQARGWLCMKFASPSRRGVPDTIWIRKGVTVFVEFKRPTGDLSELQHRWLVKIVKAGAPVFVVDSAEAGKAVLDQLDDFNEAR